MDKESISNLGFTAIAVIIFLLIFPLVVPLGQSIKGNLDDTSSDLLDSAQTFTEEYIETETYLLTIKYKYSNNEIISTYESSFKAGEKYLVVSPEIEGYVPNMQSVSGIITNNTYYEIHYSADN